MDCDFLEGATFCFDLGVIPMQFNNVIVSIIIAIKKKGYHLEVEATPS